MVKKIEFKVEAVRTIPSPTEKDVITYFTYVNFKDLPASLPLDVNPRKPNMNTTVAKSLINAVKSSDTDFDINNRGIVLVAKEFKFNPGNNTVTIDLDDNPKEFGILDGGHTYTAIIQNREDLPDKLDKFVRLEIIVGKELYVSRIAEARNNSATVSDIALYELDDKFDFIKEAISAELYSNDIAIKDNSKKRLPIIELLRLLFAYNIYKFRDANSAPTRAYSRKNDVFKDIREDIDNGTGYYKKLSVKLPDLARLYDKIELDFKQKYLDYNKNGKFGAVRGVERNKNERKPFKTLFLENNTEYRISTGYILPVFGAFRVLLKEENGKLEWKMNPFEVWDSVGESLVKNTLESSRNNPQEAGKNASIWSNNYSKVENLMLHSMLNDK